MAGEDLLGTAIIEIRASMKELGRDLDKAKATARKAIDAAGGDVEVTANVDAAVAELGSVNKALDGLDDESVRVTSDTGAALGEVRSLDKALDGVEDETVRLDVDSSGAESALGRFGGIATAALAGLGGKQLLDMGTGLEVVAAKAEIVFGESLGVVEDWAKGSASAMGLTDQAAVGLAAGLGDLLVPMGFTRAQAATMSSDVLNLAGALSLWSAGQYSTADTAGMLTDALLGETDALKAVGIDLSAAEVQSHLAAKGQADLTGEALKQAEALAVQELLLAKTADAQAFFAGGGSDAASKQFELNKAWGDATEQLSTSLLPAMTIGVGILGDLLGVFNAMPAPVQAFVVGAALLAATLGQVTGVISPLVMAHSAHTLAMASGATTSGVFAGALTAVRTAAMAAWAAITGPVGLVLLAIGAVIAIGYLLIQHWDTVKAVAAAVWEGIKAIVGGAVDFVVGLFMNFSLPGLLIQHWDTIKRATGEAWDWVAGKVGGVVDWFTGIPDRIGAVFSGMWSSVVDTAKGAFNGVASAWNSTLGSFGFTVPDWLPGVGGRSFSMPRMPTLATGGTIGAGGWATVGERGREDVWLPKGAEVVPGSRGGRGGAGGALVVNFNGPTWGGGPGLREIATAIERVADGRNYGRGRR